jgi:hypothetical protein
MILGSWGQTWVLAAEQHKQAIAGGFEASAVSAILVESAAPHRHADGNDLGLA